MRARATGASSTGARFTAPATASSSVSDCPSRTTAVGMRAMSAAHGDNSRASRLPEAAEPLVAVRRLVIVELQVRLGLQRDHEIEGEAPVGRLREGEDGAPVVQVALQRHDLAGKAVVHEVVVLLPGCRPVLRHAEAEAA